MSSEPRMENEVNDPYKASTLSFKFVAFKTPVSLFGVDATSDIVIPQKMYFSFKFFTFQSIVSEKVVIKLPNEI